MTCNLEVLSSILILKSPFASIATHHHDHHQNIKANCIYTPLFEKEVNQTLKEFKKEEESIFPPTGESLVKFMSKKQKAGKEVMLCPRYNTMFDRSAAKAFKALEFRKSFQKIQEIDVQEKEKQSISMIVSQV